MAINKRLYRKYTNKELAKFIRKGTKGGIPEETINLLLAERMRRAIKREKREAKASSQA